MAALGKAGLHVDLVTQALARQPNSLDLATEVHYREPCTMILMEFGDPPMMRRVLKGIKARAERVGAAPEAVRD